MDEQFDNELKNRIREVFDNYDDTTADEGWRQLREKFPEEQKRRVFAWMWWGAAAILLLSLGLGLWIYQTNNQSTKFTAKMPVNTKNENLNAAKVNHNTNNKTSDKEAAHSAASLSDSNKKLNAQPSKAMASVKNQAKPAKEPALPNNLTAKNVLVHKIVKNDQIAADRTTSQRSATVNKSVIAPLNEAVTSRLMAAQPGKTASNQAATSSVLATVPPNKAISNQAATSSQSLVVQQPNGTTTGEGTPSAKQPVSVQLNAPAAPIAATKPPAKTITEMFNQDRDKGPEKMKVNSKKVVFGVYAATYFNYAKGSDNEINAGGGFTADIKLTDNIRLVTGVTIAQNSLAYNTLTYNSGIPNAVVNSGFFSPGIAAATPAANSTYSTSSLSIATTPTLKNYDASLVGLDIPMNVKYIFNPQKSDTYFSLGLSSGTFISEAYTYLYNYPIVNSSSLQQTQSETSRTNFNNFYFAKTLNAAFGIGLPFGKNRIIVEPFLKYPLQGLGSQDIKFGSGGLNLKFNFQSSQK